MASYFLLELDTTSPAIEIIAPLYTTPQNVTEIIIESNEVVSSYQDIYIVDSSGNKFDLSFTHNADHFSGFVVFNQMSFGAATIHARLQDEVGNLSNIAQRVINIIKSEVYDLELSVIEKEMIVSSKSLNGVEINGLDKDIIIGMTSHEIITSVKKREIKIDWSEE